MSLRTLGLALVLTCIWLLLSGYFLPLILLLGAASIVVCVYVAHRMEVIDHEGLPIHLSLRALTYWPWLFWEICKSTWDTIWIILSPDGRLAPVVFEARASQADEVGRTTYANSITLTPGTVTLAIDDDRFLVHALNADMKDGVLGGTMDANVTRMMGETPPAPGSGGADGGAQP